MKLNLPVTHIERDYPDDERLISETNLKGFITAANASFCNVAGFSHDELIGQRHNIVRHPDVPREFFADLWRTIKAGERWTGVVKNRCKNGDHYWVRALVSPIVRDGAIIGYRSLRVKPTREEIQEAERMYQEVREGKRPGPDTLQALRQTTDWRTRLMDRITLAQLIGLIAVLTVVTMGALAVAGVRGADSTVIWAWLALGLLGVGAAARLLIKGLYAPLHRWRELASQLEQGDLSARLKVYGQSEFAHIARELNRSLDAIELLTSEMSQVLSGMARGDLSRRVLITLPGGLHKIQQSVNGAAEQMEATVRDLSTRLAALAEGRFDEQAVVDNAARGAFREVQTHAQRATGQLGELLTQLTTTTKAVAEGDLTRTVTVNGAGQLQAFYDQLNGAQVKMGHALAIIQERTTAVAAASGEISASAEEIAQGATTQTGLVQEVRGLLSAAAKEVMAATEAAIGASHRSGETVAVVTRGKAQMDRMMDVVRSIERNSNEIAGITSIIEDVAAQTNLLALNAAIEAARAGESGKGFAVVAQEVLKLATTAAQSTQNIRTLVDEAIGASRQADAEANEVAKGMHDIEHHVVATDELLQHVAQVLQAQSAALQEADQRTVALAHIAQGNALATEELATFAEELLQTAEAVHREVGRFKLPL